MYEPMGERGTRIGKAKANAAIWRAPAGHATWCVAAVPFVRYASAGDTPMARAQCSCGRNALARSLRKLAGRDAA